MNNENELKLEKLRDDMRLVTGDIIKLVQERMNIASQIGNIKNNLMMKIEDISVEQEIARYVYEFGPQIGLNRDKKNSINKNLKQRRKVGSYDDVFESQTTGVRR
jgi:aspartate aminotransferase